MKPGELFEEVKRKANVVGYSLKPQPRIRNGKTLPELCFRVYVSRKLPAKELRATDVIPREIGGVPVDVVEVGEVRALGYTIKEGKPEKTRRFRPVIFGVSIGHVQVTAGTNGFLFADKKGNQYFGSNAHVLTPDPSKEPDRILVKDIVQPGPYDGGTLADKVAEYVWHRRIVPVGGGSGCPVARVWAGIYNSLAKALGARTRLVPVIAEPNRVDFAVASPKTEFLIRFPDFDFTGHKFVGLGFAGSDVASLVCKAGHIADEGYYPVGAGTAEVREGDVVMKTGRTSCFTKAKVIDASAAMKVGYGSFTAWFEDVVLTEKLLEPGDSGSSVWL